MAEALEKGKESQYKLYAEKFMAINRDMLAALPKAEASSDDDEGFLNSVLLEQSILYDFKE